MLPGTRDAITETERRGEPIRRTIRPLHTPTPAPEPPAPESPVPAPTRRGVGAAWAIFRALLMMLLVLLALNTQALQTTVERRPDGPIRTIFLGVSRGLNTAAGKVGLERPMAWFDYAQADRDNVPTFAGQPGVGTAVAAAPPAAAPTPADPAASPQPSVEQGASTEPAAQGSPVASSGPAAASSAPSAAPTVAPSAAPTAPPQRAVTNAAPLRVYVAGDSFVNSIAEVLADRSTNGGMLAALADGHANSGLSDPSYTNWPVRLGQALAAQPPPEAVVFMVGANDGVAIRTPNGTLEYGTEAWNAEYSRRAGEIMDVVGKTGARLYYIGQPIMRESKQNRIANDINIAIVKAAATRPWVTYIDSWALLADRDGTYSTYLVADNGETVKARADDGIHLTPASTVWVAKAALRAMFKDWKIPE